MTGEDTADYGALVCAVVNCRVRELAIALYLLVVTICKCSVNPITNPNPVCSHLSCDVYFYGLLCDAFSIYILVASNVRMDDE
jgi:hypothetical protein